jgi:hypothetical protein
LKEVERNGCIEAFEAQRIVFDLLPKRKQRIPTTSSARPKHVWFLRLRRILTPSEKRDASVAASASRSLARLCKRGFLTCVCWGNIRVSDSEVRSEKWEYIRPFYMLTDKGRLTRSATGWPPLTDRQAQENRA